MLSYRSRCSSSSPPPLYLCHLSDFQVAPALCPSLVPAPGRPSNCPKIYTNSILGEQNLLQNDVLNQIYFNSSVFCIRLVDYTRQPHNTIHYIWKVNHGSTDYSPAFHWTFTKKIHKILTKKSINGAYPV